MKITKYVHSCLLVETPDRVGIIDPGEFSWESGLFDVNKLDRLDDIVITHEHFDHIHMPFIKALLEKFPDVNVISNNSVVELLKKEGIQASHIGNEAVELFHANHETMEPLAPPPCPNTGVHYLGLLTHPGDCHHFEASKDILALPVTGPWGTVPRAAEIGKELKPRYIIPIHDWHWNNTARAGFYDRFEAFFKDLGITFLKVEDSVGVEI